ncbi:MAG: hypothetical protein WCG52_06655, partial [bacterium]
FGFLSCGEFIYLNASGLALGFFTIQTALVFIFLEFNAHITGCVKKLTSPPHPAVKEHALKLAELQGRSLSELVERLLEREIGKQTFASYEAVMQEAQPPFRKRITATYSKANSSPTRKS